MGENKSKKNKKLKERAKAIKDSKAVIINVPSAVAKGKGKI